MPTPFSGAPIERGDGGPVHAAERLRLLRVQREEIRRAANSGCVSSTPESTIVTGFPGPGGARPATPIAARHHSERNERIGEVGHAQRPGGAVGD